MSNKPKLESDYLYRIEGPNAINFIAKEGFRIYKSTHLENVDDMPAEIFYARSSGWEIPQKELLTKLKIWYFTSIDAARKDSLYRDRTLCRYKRKHEALGDDKLIFVDGCMQNGTAVYVIFPNAIEKEIVISQEFIEYFDKEKNCWFSINQWNENFLKNIEIETHNESQSRITSCELKKSHFNIKPSKKYFDDILWKKVEYWNIIKKLISR